MKAARFYSSNMDDLEGSGTRSILWRTMPTIFGNVLEKNVSFVIDTSGSMYPHVNVIKKHLVDLLLARANSGRDTMFNIITFCEEIHKWAGKLVPCSPRTVNIAREWIDKISCGTTTDNMNALIEAYDDQGLDAIYLVTDGLPEQTHSQILQTVHHIHQGRPLHIVCLVGSSVDNASIDFLHKLAKVTNGSFHLVYLSIYGEILRIVPIFSYKPAYARTYDCGVPFINGKNFDYLNYSPLTGLLPSMQYKDTFSTPPRVAWDNYVGTSLKSTSYARSCGIDLDNLAEPDIVGKINISAAASSLMKGKKVLVRKESDGLYYMGTIVKQLPHEKFEVKFDKCPALRHSYSQETAVYNMVGYEDALRRHVFVGDKVLAQWQPDGRYGPGSVLEGVDRRDCPPQGNVGGNVIVSFYNGQTLELQPGAAVRVPLAVYDRVITELQLPETQRRKIQLASLTETPKYEGKPPQVHTTWTRPFSPPRTAKANTTVHFGDALKMKIKKQLRDSQHLLDNLELTETVTTEEEDDFKPVIIENGLSEEDYRLYEESLESEESFEGRAEVIPLVPDEYKSARKFTLPAAIKQTTGSREVTRPQWRYIGTSTTTSSSMPFRETFLSKPAEPRSNKPSPPRPPHSDYHTVDGDVLPLGTDKKFMSSNTIKSNNESRPVDNGPPYYYCPGRRDVYEKNMSNKEHAVSKAEHQRLEYHRRNAERQERHNAQKIQDQERNKQATVEYHKGVRNQVTERDQTKQEKAENWKHDRIQAMKGRTVKHEDMEKSFEKAAQQHQEKRIESQKGRENVRIDAHRQRLADEKNYKESRTQRFKDTYKLREAQLDNIKKTADKNKEQDRYVKEQTFTRYKASILP